jgi:hypothetical protein
MSGIEVAGLAVGVVPILVEVVKSYSTVREKVRTFRHCTQEVKEISADFCVIQITFKNEVRWLLRAIQNEQQAKSILDDGEDWRLVSGELSTQLHAVLKDSYGTCCDIMERTKLILEEMEDELEKFDVLLIEKSQVSVKCVRGAKMYPNVHLPSDRVHQVDIQTSAPSAQDHCQQIKVRQMPWEPTGQKQ